MRLLRTDTKELILETVVDGSTPYAILSHRWLPDAEEITYDDLRGQRTNNPILQEKQGWQKLEYCRRQARQDGLRYIWVDTCCISTSTLMSGCEHVTSRRDCCLLWPYRRVWHNFRHSNCLLIGSSSRTQYRCS
jgi:hypothetical protein